MSLEPTDLYKVQKLLQDLVANLLIQKPDEPVPYLTQYLLEI